MNKYILFDLDGTLTDSLLGITRCIQYALKKSGVEEPDLEKLKSFCGPPLRVTFKGNYGFDDAKAERAVAYYRERYIDVGMWENAAFPGMVELVRDLKSAGRHCAVATSKPENFACMIVAKYGFMLHLDTCCGCSLDGKTDAKWLVVREALRRLHVEDLSEAVLVGDRYNDVEAAHKCGIKCIGVGFGYGGKQELADWGCDYYTETVEDLRRLLMEM